MLKKPVFEVTADTMWDYEYQAKHFTSSTWKGDYVEIIASESLINLKKEVKERGWSLAWLTTRSGAFSRGQQVHDEIPYEPRRKY